MQIITTEKVPIKMWLDEIEEGALEQAKNVANLPSVQGHVAVMPDAHQGYGMPIGTVVATKDIIIPNAVGVDIGCGMCAVKTSLTEIDTKTLKIIMSEIRKVIPLGFNHHKEPQDESLMPDPNKMKHYMLESITTQEYKKALTQIGTLGGGNHFIEIQKGNDKHIWIMIHSGSRNIGYMVANYYNKLAQTLNEKWHCPTPKEHQLAYLPINIDEGQRYISEMQYCVDFALANRKLMMDRICKIFLDVLEIKEYINFDKMINIAHNYATLENHFGHNVWVHRKGATLAKKDTIGIIPGSQGTKSYIVQGTGNRESLMSCSHGAGRTMSRKKAREDLNIKEQTKLLNDQGILHAIRNEKDLDEAPGAYKNIDKVMENQKDLIKILVELTPLAVIKG